VLLDDESSMLFAGVVYYREHGFLPSSMNVHDWQRTGVETAEISIPLSYYNCSTDPYGHRIVGGGLTRHWAQIGKILLKRGKLDDSDLDGKQLTVGPNAIWKRKGIFSYKESHEVLEQLLSLEIR